MTLLVTVKQGEDKNKNFTLKQDSTTALDITGATITVEVKESPFYSVDALFTKTITETSDADTVGQITDPTNGIFDIRFTLANTTITPTDYYLVIKLTLNGETRIVTSANCESAIYRVCTQ